MAARGYLAYGLGIRSPIPLPELVAQSGRPDVVVRLGRVDGVPAELPSGGSTFRVTLSEIAAAWPDVGAIAVRGGSEIVVDPAPGVEEAALRLFLLGPALGIALHQRGRLVLHASAVALGPGAVAFLGGSGWGKSTTAAALHTRGHPLVSDDVLALGDPADAWPCVYPGFPQLKLSPEAAASLGDAVDALPRLHASHAKRARPAPEGFSPGPRLLARLYVLADGERLGLEPLAPNEQVIELVRHSYCAPLLPATTAAANLRQCAGLVARVPVLRLRRPRDLDRLDDLAALVEADVAASVA